MEELARLTELTNASMPLTLYKQRSMACLLGLVLHRARKLMTVKWLDNFVYSTSYRGIFAIFLRIQY
jgi:hypothetical protein